MKLRPRATVFLLSLALLLLTAGARYAYLRAHLIAEAGQRARATLQVRAQLAAEVCAASPLELRPQVDWSPVIRRLASATMNRVTVVARDGEVIADSRVPIAQLTALDNHAGRPELQDALDGRPGTAERHSASLEQRLRYAAAPIRRGNSVVGAARVAAPAAIAVDLAGLNAELAASLVGAFVVALLISSLSIRLSTQTIQHLTASVRRMADGDLSTRTAVVGHDDFDDLSRAVDQLARSLSRSLEALRQQRDRLGGIISGMQEGVLVLDAEGRIALVNPTLREMLLLGSDATGKTPLEVVRHAELKELLDECRETGETVNGEIELAGIKPRQLVVRVAPLGGDQAGVFAIFVDVTEMRRLETMRRDFVANVSHELRTPVTAIRSAAETLEGALAADPRAAGMFVDIIDRNAERLHGLVEDLLDLSRIESREFRLNLEELDLHQVFHQVLSLFQERANKKNIELDLQIQEGEVLARADRKALEHVLTNLVDNAVKYCPPGSHIRLRAEETDRNIEASVSDDGHGIDSRHLPRLFERFYRVDTGRSRELGGTGLGLSIVKHVVEAMRGSVRVESTQGEGTTFHFTLLRADQPASTRRF